MPRSTKKKKARRRAKTEPQAPEFANNPFQDLAGQLREAARAKPARPKPAAPKPIVSPSDEQMWRRAMEDVTPLPGQSDQVTPAAGPRAIVPPDEDKEVLALLADLCAGEAPLDVRDTEEYVEGCRPGLDRRIVRKLRRGDFSVQAHLDLHGMTLNAARDAVHEFIGRSQRQGWRCILFIHGRGINSPDGKPIIKRHLVGWLSRSGLRKNVLAFATARPYDGGGGALYVLLKKRNIR